MDPGDPFAASDEFPVGPLSPNSVVTNQEPQVGHPVWVGQEISATQAGKLLQEDPEEDPEKVFREMDPGKAMDIPSNEDPSRFLKAKEDKAPLDPWAKVLADDVARLDRENVDLKAGHLALKEELQAVKEELQAVKESQKSLERQIQAQLTRHERQIQDLQDLLTGFKAESDRQHRRRCAA